jgi:hypothetical protein
MILSSVAQAETYYFVNGKTVSAGQATKAAMNDTKAQVVKIQVATQQYNDDSGKLKKAQDLTLEQLKALLK